MVAGGIIAGAMLGSFTCLAPVHDNASTVRCANHPEVIRLMGYDAPAMPATCLPSEICPPGDPFAARDALRGLTMGRPLSCEAAGIDNQGRTLARCRVESIDLSCAMLETNHAVLSKTAGDCNCTPVRRRPALLQSVRYEPGAPPAGLPQSLPNPLPAGSRITLDLGDSNAANRPRSPAPVVMDATPLRETPWSLPVDGAVDTPRRPPAGSAAAPPAEHHWYPDRAGDRCTLVVDRRLSQLANGLAADKQAKCPCP